MLARSDRLRVLCHAFGATDKDLAAALAKIRPNVARPRNLVARWWSHSAQPDKYTDDMVAILVELAKRRGRADLPPILIGKLWTHGDYTLAEFCSLCSVEITDVLEMLSPVCRRFIDQSSASMYLSQHSRLTGALRRAIKELVDCVVGDYNIYRLHSSGTGLCCETVITNKRVEVDGLTLRGIYHQFSENDQEREIDIYISSVNPGWIQVSGRYVDGTLDKRESFMWHAIVSASGHRLRKLFCGILLDVVDSHTEIMSERVLISRILENEGRSMSPCARLVEYQSAEYRENRRLYDGYKKFLENDSEDDDLTVLRMNPTRLSRFGRRLL